MSKCEFIYARAQRSNGVNDHTEIVVSPNPNPNPISLWFGGKERITAYYL